MHLIIESFTLGNDGNLHTFGDVAELFAGVNHCLDCTLEYHPSLLLAQQRVIGLHLSRLTSVTQVAPFRPTAVGRLALHCFSKSCVNSVFRLKSLSGCGRDSLDFLAPYSRTEFSARKADGNFAVDIDSFCIADDVAARVAGDGIATAENGQWTAFVQQGSELCEIIVSFPEVTCKYTGQFCLPLGKGRPLQID